MDSLRHIVDRMPRCEHGVCVYELCPACLQVLYDEHVADRLAKLDPERNGALPATSEEWLAHLDEIAPKV